MFKFKKPNNELEGAVAAGKGRNAAALSEEKSVCPSCKKQHNKSELEKEYLICQYCGYHFRLGARARIAMIADEGTFIEHDEALQSENVLEFPEYDAKLKKALDKSREKEAVVCGICEVEGCACALFSMEVDFMMGSMGSVVGEKISRLFEYAAANCLPVIGFAVSGGARMQEGTLSLMQMAKTSGAVKRHSDAGNLYVAVLTDPTSGGVTASFAMLGDIIIAEPGALICFAGPRVIEQTIRQKLPAGFQKAEFLLEKGFLDDVIDRRKLRAYLGRLLSLHKKEAVL